MVGERMSHAQTARRARTVSLLELLVWTYRDQRAHRYLRTAYDWFAYMIEADELFGPDTQRAAVDRDAATVHAVVCDLSSEDAQILVYYALIAEAPQLWDADIVPRARPVPVSRGFDDYGRAEIDGRLTDYKIGVSERMSERVPIMRRVSRRRAVIVGYEVETIEVKYCPIVWEPSPELTIAYNGIVANWRAAMRRFAGGLSLAHLVSHQVDDLELWVTP